MASPSLPVVAGGAAIAVGAAVMASKANQDTPAGAETLAPNADAFDLAPPDDKHITPHFTWKEFQSHDGVMPEGEDRQNVGITAQWLEAVRDWFGGQPITIVSGFRSATHNDAVEGADHSLHLTGQAADFTVAGVSNNDVAAGVEAMIKAGKLPQGGLGVYPGWVHWDWRGYKARWAGH